LLANFKAKFIEHFLSFNILKIYKTKINLKKSEIIIRKSTKSKVLLLIVLGILVFLSPILIKNINVGNENSTIDYNKNLKPSKISTPIYLHGNSDWVDFKNAGDCTGNGILSDPYVIQDLIIDAGGSGSCIMIADSDVFFRIENCTLYNAGGFHHAGINLDNVTNGHLFNNNCSSNINDARGIRLLNSDYNNITNNLLESNEEGITVFGLYNLISENNASNSGAGITSSSGSNFNTITENRVFSNGEGIHVAFNINNTISNNLVYDNGNNGIASSSCNFTNIFGNILDNNRYGIAISYNSYTIISNNTSNNNRLDGLTALLSNYNNISENILNYNARNGIIIDRCDFNIISGNTANNNTAGIYLDTSCDNNLVSGNTLEGNDICIFEDDTCTGNIFRDNGSCTYGQGGGGGIPGYILPIFLGTLSLAVIILSKKVKK